MVTTVTIITLSVADRMSWMVSVVETILSRMDHLTVILAIIHSVHSLPLPGWHRHYRSVKKSVTTLDNIHCYLQAVA